MSLLVSSVAVRNRRGPISHFVESRTDLFPPGRGYRTEITLDRFHEAASTTMVRDALQYAHGISCTNGCQPKIDGAPCRGHERVD